METIVKTQGITCHFIPTDKFKTNTLVFKMKAPLRRETATMRALLPHVLQSATHTYPSMTEVRSRLEELYGATLNVDLQKKGEYHIISIAMEVANEKFLSGAPSLLKESLDLFREVIRNPKMEQGAFAPAIVEREKRNLKQRIQSVFDDKMRYASLRLIEEMCREEPYAIPVYGILADVEPVNPHRLFHYYQSCLAEDALDLYLVGNFPRDEMMEWINRHLAFQTREPERVEKRNPISRKETKVVVERQDILQGKLNIGFRTNIRYGDPDYFALQVFNGLFGGFPHSKLFMNVREKASLAYYASSRLESHKGLLLVMTGIEPENYERAREIIFEQWEEMKSGRFSEEDLAKTKAVIKNQMLETFDIPRGLVEVLYHNVIGGNSMTEKDWFTGLEAVTKEDVIAVGEKTWPDTVYFLTRKEE